MSLLKQGGKLIGKASGLITGEPIKFIGKKLNNEYIQEIGESVKKASECTGKTLGNVADGTWNTASGSFNKDDGKKDKGINELKETFSQTAKGVGNSLKETYTKSKDVVQGIKENDKEKVINGAKGIGKTVAVATIAVGVLDVLDVIDVDGNETINHVQAEEIDSGESLTLDNSQLIETRNDSLVGEEHPVTDVPFEEKNITLPSGESIQGIFPDFEEEYSIQMPESMYLENDNAHFFYANHSLAEYINQNPEFASHFSNSQIEQIYSNQTPDGYTWHHSEEPGKLELVNSEIHEKTAHTGGREIWGGGMENR